MEIILCIDDNYKVRSMCHTKNTNKNDEAGTGKAHIAHQTLNHANVIGPTFYFKTYDFGKLMGEEEEQPLYIG